MGEGKKKYIKYLYVYTILFAAIFSLGYSAFFKNGKAFMWHDGYIQHYPALIYIGKYLRKIFTNFMAGDFSIPMFDFNLGMGQNIIAMLNLFDGFGDPLLILSAFTPVRYSEALYNALVVVRMYLAGLGFSWYCFYMKKPGLHVITGALIYVFCGYALYSGVRHPSFITPMIYFPILLIGIDKIINGQKPYLFIITVCIAAVNGFYFLYVATIFVFLYALIRYFSIHSGSKRIPFIKVFTHSILSYGLGIMMSAFIFVPAVMGYLTSARSNSRVDPGNLLIYNPGYYFREFLASVSPSGSWKFLSLAGLAMFAVILLIMRKDHQYRPLKWALRIGFLFYLIPFGGYITNGFSYVSGRWTFIFSFLISLIVVYIMPVIQNLNKREKHVFSAVVILYGAIGLVHPLVRNGYTIFGFFVLSISLFILLLIQQDTIQFILRSIKAKFNGLPITSATYENPGTIRKIGAIICCLLVSANLSAGANLMFSERGNHYISQFKKTGKALDNHVNSEVAAALPLPDKEFYRVDSIARHYQNASMILDYPSATAYFSIMNSHVSNGLNSLEDVQLAQAYNLYGLDNRAALDALASVKYISAQDGVHEEYVPFGFIPSCKRKRNHKKYTIYENQYVLPLGYTYSTYITEGDYNNMTALEKQEAMMQSVVLADTDRRYAKGKPKSTTKPLSYGIQRLDGVTWNGKDLTVTKENASIRISFDKVSNSETYVRLKNLNIDDSGVENFYMKVSSGKVTKTCRVMSKSYKFGLGRKNYLVNLGYSKDGKNTASILLPKVGKFKLNAIEVFSQPMNDFPAQAEALMKEPLENIKVTTNNVAGTVNLSEDKILCLGIGYSDGWSAKADGKKVDILKANGMFIAIPLTKGYHKIELNYCTPGIKAGTILSLIGVFAFAFIALTNRNKTGKKSYRPDTKTIGGS